MRARAAVWLVLGVGLLVGAAAALYFATRSDLLTAYNSAPMCAAFADAAAGGDCRYTTTATVTRVFRDAHGATVVFQVPGQYGRSFEASLPLTVTMPTVGDQARVEFWRFRATRFAGATTLDNPVNDPRPGNLRTIGLVRLSLGLAAAVWAVVLLRRPRNDHAVRANLTPVATSDVLRR